MRRQYIILYNITTAFNPLMYPNQDIPDYTHACIATPKNEKATPTNLSEEFSRIAFSQLGVITRIESIVELSLN